MEKERLVKQNARHDATFCRNEASQELKGKRVFRANPLNIDKEHLFKQNARQDETFQQNEAIRDLKRKRDFRANPLNLEQKRFA